MVRVVRRALAVWFCGCVSQNRQAAREDVRADLDFETNVRSEVWSIHMGRALGLDPAEVERKVQEVLTENRAWMIGSGQCSQEEGRGPAAGPTAQGPAGAAPRWDDEGDVQARPWELCAMLWT
ncbi:hypothetical protein [Streptomyces sioyaensis]|uniref:hypothetical protein n=1 Tax=Streptomyces sioyaensis TaxID=67364 RepID=UPI0036E6BAF3